MSSKWTDFSKVVEISCFDSLKRCILWFIHWLFCPKSPPFCNTLSFTFWPIGEYSYEFIQSHVYVFVWSVYTPLMNLYACASSKNHNFPYESNHANSYEIAKNSFLMRSSCLYPYLRGQPFVVVFETIVDII